MDIPSIKARLTLSDVLKHYGLKPDKNLRLHCPFHPDKTPSLQVYYKTHTAYCFSSNCPTHGKSLDVIDFIMHLDKSNKHEAILKAQSLLTGTAPKPLIPITKVAILTKMFTYFKNAVHNSAPAKAYLESRKLEYSKLDVGYNSGQFHHGTRKDEALIKSCLEVGLLLPGPVNTRSGEPGYKPFGKNCIVFPLKDAQHQISGLYFRSLAAPSPLERAGGEARHFYLKDRKGLYPAYPEQTVKTLILTESVIDAASLLQQGEISGTYAVLALYGTNGLTEEHLSAITSLTQLEEVVFFLNGDQPGREAVKKHSHILQELLPQVTISQVETPEGEDVNSLLQSHEPAVLLHLIEKRTLLFSTESSIENPSTQTASTQPVAAQPATDKTIPVDKASGEKEKPVPPPLAPPAAVAVAAATEQAATEQAAIPALDTTNPHKLTYRTLTAAYYIAGGLKEDLDSLRVTLVVEQPGHSPIGTKQARECAGCERSSRRGPEIPHETRLVRKQAGRENGPGSG